MPYQTRSTSVRQRRQRPISAADPRNSTRKRQGLARWEVDARIKAQGGLCALCLRPLGDETMVDHDHALAHVHGHDAESGCAMCVRGVLCRGCNSWLAGFRAEPDFLLRAARYAASRRPR